MSDQPSNVSDGVRDYDYHPHESTVRQFDVPPRGVLRLDDSVFVSAAKGPRAKRTRPSRGGEADAAPHFVTGRC